MLDHEATGNDRDDWSTLTAIMGRIGVAPKANPAGWNCQNARLFAIDAAMTAVRRDASVLSEADRHNLTSYLQDAKDLVVADRDDELGSLQAAMEARLSLIAPGRHRQLWLTAIDSLLPSPHRAALVSIENAISLGNTETLADLSTLLRDRLSADSGGDSLRLRRTTRLQTTA